MRPSAWMRIACVTMCLLSAGAASAQSPAPSPKAMAAARDLIAAMRTAENLKATMPAIMQSLKPVFVQNRPQVERDYDATMPLLIERINTRLNEFIEQLAAVYARAFTAEELREAVNFYRGPTGQKFAQQDPLIVQESSIIWKRFRQSVGAGMTEELRKRGHDIPFMTILSGSMGPTLSVGNWVRVVPTKQLERGDVVAFYLPNDKSTIYVKRIVGLGGDVIQMVDGVLHINGTPVKRERIEDFVETKEGARPSRVKQWRETLPNGVSYATLDLVDNGFYDTTRPYEVPAGHYFMMGDNRDNSTDSRVLSQVGYVPVENIIGKASPYEQDRDISSILR